MGRVTERRKVIRIRDGALSSRPDTLVTEEPLEIRLNGKPLAKLGPETDATRSTVTETVRARSRKRPVMEHHPASTAGTVPGR